MAENKKSFVAYSDWKNIFDELPDEDAGKLIKHIFAYVNDENPISESILINAVFANIKTTLKRDLQKWETQLNQRKEAGKLSAELRKAKLNDRSTPVEIRARKSTDNVSVNVSVSDNVNEKENNILVIRQNKFKEEVFSFKNFYTEKLLSQFYDYWSEKTKNGKQMKMELQKTWETSKRLATWQRNNFGNNQEQTEIRLPNQPLKPVF